MQDCAGQILGKVNDGVESTVSPTIIADVATSDASFIPIAATLSRWQKVCTFG